ncbi:hypothetical protein LOK49_LG03G03590 [Camellia lanceoleosa]|uniref:Uncharacterized protein n=1 Tax=Camellia lanceoleosa TaxID=1840588 RepID=A0ACC0IEW5_9ERIC|nr:hypothetical protein LOK49_LG03G03590 [Camellia lanceoleosa]
MEKNGMEGIVKVEVRVNTILGFVAPSLSVKLKQAFSSSSKDASIIESQVLQLSTSLSWGTLVNSLR